MRKILIVAVGILCVGAAGAQEHERHGRRDGMMFERADKNADGYVSRDEFRDARGEQFSHRDRNGDGFIDSTDLSERAASRPRATQAMGALVTQLDADGDHKINKSEFVEGGAKAFDRVDADKNGSLDKKELEAVKEKFRERAEQREAAPSKP